MNIKFRKKQFVEDPEEDLQEIKDTDAGVVVFDKDSRGIYVGGDDVISTFVGIGDGGDDGGSETVEITAIGSSNYTHYVDITPSAPKKIKSYISSDPFELLFTNNSNGYVIDPLARVGLIGFDADPFVDGKTIVINDSTMVQDGDLLDVSVDCLSQSDNFHRITDINFSNDNNDVFDNCFHVDYAQLTSFANTYDLLGYRTYVLKDDSGYTVNFNAQNIHINDLSEIGLIDISGQNFTILQFTIVEYENPMNIIADLYDKDWNAKSTTVSINSNDFVNFFRSYIPYNRMCYGLIFRYISSKNAWVIYSKFLPLGLGIYDSTPSSAIESANHGLYNLLGIRLNASIADESPWVCGYPDDGNMILAVIGSGGSDGEDVETKRGLVPAPVIDGEEGIDDRDCFLHSSGSWKKATLAWDIYEEDSEE